MQAHSYTGSTLDDEFYINDDVTIQNDNIWSTALMYFWPGTGRTLDFYAWAPANAEDYGLTAPLNPNKTTLAYTVPLDVAEQKDISVATATGIPGDSYSAVPLTFNHIFTAVRFVIGDQMQPGTIKSVALSGVYNSGTYNMAAAEGTNPWELGATVAYFSQLMTFSTTGNETSGEAITSDEGTFMMLPQTLPDGAEIQIVFLDNATDTERTLTASIAGSEWPMGKTVTYKISILPEYEFYLDGYLETIPLLDAHFEIFQANLIADVPDGTSWTITGSDNVTIQNQSNMNSYAKQGYWTDKNVNDKGEEQGSARGNSSYSITGNGTFPIAIFVPENTGDATRTIALNINVGENTVQTINIEQLAPNWFSGTLGCERIEGDERPWGFYWSSDFRLIYDLRNCDKDARGDIRSYISWTKGLYDLKDSFIGPLITWIFGDDIPDLSFVDMETSGGFFGIGAIADKITINLGDLTTGDLATSEDLGQENTQDIYNFEGIQFVNEIINMVNIPGVIFDTDGTGTIPNNNASIYCMKLNSWNIISIQNNTMLTLTSDSNTPDWYLPARNEVTDINDTEYPLNGEYWTSTAANDNQNAFMYSAESGTTAIEQRDQLLHVRAVRKRP